MTVNRFDLERWVLETEHDEDDPPWEVAVPIIDGQPLFETVGDRLPGLAVTAVGPPSRQWLGAPDYEEDGRAVVLDGTCGEAGCCGVFARIEIGEKEVRWADFSARGRPPLPDGLEFTFDRHQYEAAIVAVRSAPRHRWGWPEDAL